MAGRNHRRIAAKKVEAALNLIAALRLVRGRAEGPY